MPRKKTKTRETQLAENYFPVDTSDVKYTTEKSVKTPTLDVRETIEIPVKQTLSDAHRGVEKQFKKIISSAIETVEKINPLPPSTKKKATRKKYSKKKSTKKTPHKITTMKKFIPQKITLKKNSYELIITEKPQAANKIATALGKTIQKNINKVPYYELTRNNKKIIVACAVGHLFTLTQNTTGSYIPIFDISWTPNYLARKADFTKRYYDALLKLIKDAGSLTVATDFDIEGEVIGMNVVKLIGNQPDAERMKFSTLTKAELEKAYESKLPHIEWGQAIAGETRHYLDWFYGINLSRALMNAIKTTGRFKIMSIGRVQGPALNLVVKKEKEIQAFKSEPYWQVFITIDDETNKLELKHIKDIFNKKELSKFENLVGKTALASTTKTSQILPPPVPFNLTTLQTEAYKFHGISPSNTLRAAQSLYLAGLISYPRTSSQKLPDSIDYKSILEKLKILYKVSKLITKSKPIEGNKTDPAHPSIYPTGETQILSGDEEKIYNLIVKRFLSLFCDDAIIDNKTVKAIVDNLTFSARGSAIRKKAWLEIYPSKMQENSIPDMDGEVKIIDQKIEEKETQPPRRFSPASIISQLEKKNLGTKATRSSIIETLFDRGYVRGQHSIEATPLGISLIDSLEKYSPIIIDEALTRKFEQQMESLQQITDSKSKNHIQKELLLEKEKSIIEKAKETITKIAKQFSENEIEIGKELLHANVEYREQQKIENRIMPCPTCNKGHLAITYSPKTKRYFIACDAYPDCKNTFPLPPNGLIKKTEKHCEECQHLMLMRLTKGKRPWIFCWNPKCPTNKERMEEYRKKQENQ